jgi:tetratricopeptide (TPR) repeat protein
MKAFYPPLASFVVALVMLFIASFSVSAQTTTLDELFTRLETSDADEAGRIEREIWLEWSKSGSPAMDLLLQRGKDAMEAGDFPAAVEHLTALIDHDPAFAEGWNARATAYFMMGEFGPSVDDIAHTLSLNTRHFGALSGLGMIFEQLEQPEKALEAYRAALAIHPHMPAVLDSVERLETQIAGQNL